MGIPITDEPVCVRLLGDPDHEYTFVANKAHDSKAINLVLVEYQHVKSRGGGVVLDQYWHVNGGSVRGQGVNANRDDVPWDDRLPEKCAMDLNKRLSRQFNKESKNEIKAGQLIFVGTFHGGQTSRLDPDGISERAYVTEDEFRIINGRKKKTQLRWRDWNIKGDRADCEAIIDRVYPGTAVSMEEHKRHWCYIWCKMEVAKVRNVYRLEDADKSMHLAQHEMQLMPPTVKTDEELRRMQEKAEGDIHA